VPKETGSECLDVLIREALQKRLEPAGTPASEVQWHRLRQKLASKRNASRIKLGPWSVSPRGLVAYGLLLLLVMLPLTFYDQISATGPRWFKTVTAERGSERSSLSAITPGPSESANGDPVPKQPADLEVPTPENRSSVAPEPGSSLMATGDLEDGTEAATETDVGTDPALAAAGLTCAPADVVSGLTLEQLPEVAPFMVWFPRELPPGFGLIDITYEPHGTKAGKVILYFDHPDGRYLRIEQELLAKPVPEEEVLGGAAQTVTVRSRTGQMLVREEDWTVLRWVENETRFKMWGQLPPKDIIRVAESLQALRPVEEHTLRN